MQIQVPWCLMLAKARVSKKTAKNSSIKACHQWPSSEHVKSLQDLLNRAKEKIEQKPEYERMRCIELAELLRKYKLKISGNKDEKIRRLKDRDKDSAYLMIEKCISLYKPKIESDRDNKRKKRDGFSLNPKDGYPDNREIIFIKPGKEAAWIKSSAPYTIVNPHDMLPLILKDNEEVALTTQTKGTDANMGELSREMAKIRRIDKSIYLEVSAILFRMAMYYDKDHETNDSGAYVWSPDNNMRTRISKIQEEIDIKPDESFVDLWNFLLICQAISFQEDVKYNDDFCKKNNITMSSKVGRYNCLISIILWGHILGSNNDEELKKFSNKFNVLLVHRSVITMNILEIRDFFKEIMPNLSEEMRLQLYYESITKLELAELLRDSGLKISGNKEDMITRLISSNNSSE